jgi:hypothetical protein
MVPVGVVEPAVTERVAVLVGVNELGLTEQVAFTGHPDTERVTDELNPFSAVTVTVEVPAVPPCATVIVVGFAESEKSGAGAPPHPLNLKEPICVYQP